MLLSVTGGHFSVLVEVLKPKREYGLSGVASATLWEHPAPKAGALPNCAIARYAIKAQGIIINDAGYIACRAYEFKKVPDSLDSV